MTDPSDYFFALQHCLHPYDKHMHEVHLRELKEQGYGNFDENLKRLRKFQDDHVNRVIDDYAENPIKEADEQQKVQTLK